MDLVIRATVGFLFVFLLTRAGRAPRAVVAGAVRPDPARGDRRPRPAGDHAERLLGHRDDARGRRFALLTVAVSYTNFRFPRLRPILEGEPVIVVQDGKPIDAISGATGSRRRSSPARRARSRSPRSTTSSGPCSRRAARSASSRSAPRLLSVPLYLTEQDVEALLTPEDALEPIEQCFGRLARGAIDNRPRMRRRLEGGMFAVMSAVDHELGLAGAEVLRLVAGGTPFVVVLFDTERGRAGRGDRGGPARPAANGRGERGRGHASGARGAGRSA